MASTEAKYLVHQSIDSSSSTSGPGGECASSPPPPEPPMAPPPPGDFGKGEEDGAGIPPSAEAGMA